MARLSEDAAHRLLLTVMDGKDGQEITRCPACYHFKVRAAASAGMQSKTGIAAQTICCLNEKCTGKLLHGIGLLNLLRKLKGALS